MSNYKIVRRFETDVIKRIFDEAHKQGFTVNLVDYNESQEPIAKGCGACRVDQYLDEIDCLDFRLEFMKDEKEMGWALLVPGNGAEIISDYSANEVTESILKLANTFCDDHLD